MQTTLTVRQGKRYRARLRLGMIEGTAASNAMVADKFKALGFVDVEAHGDGRDRWVEGTWPGATESREVDDDHIVNVIELPGDA